MKANLWKDLLDSALALVQRLIPEAIRAAFRRPYLHFFYFRLYPERRIRTGPLGRVPPVINEAGGVLAYSAYEPFLQFKRRFCHSLPLDCRSVRSGATGLVSVVLPVYNGDPFLAEAIESVLSQTYRNYELILVDDGSTDATPEILAGYSNHPRVRLLAQSNRGLPGALNAGFRVARGEFFTWTSADNVMLPAQLDRLASFLLDQRDAEMVYSDVEVIDASGRPSGDPGYCDAYRDPAVPSIVRWPRDPGRLIDLLHGNFVGACFLYRAWAAAIAGGFVENAFYFEDYEYWMRINALFRVAHLGTSEVLYRYRVHNASLTARAAELSIEARTTSFLSAEEERRDLYTAPGNFVFQGNHPWFRPLQEILSTAGHCINTAAGSGGDLLIRSTTRTACTDIPGIMVDKPEIHFHVANDEPEAGAAALAYPIVALLAQRRWETARSLPVSRRPDWLLMA